jgi:hypothetical protein
MNFGVHGMVEAGGFLVVVIAGSCNGIFPFALLGAGANFGLLGPLGPAPYPLDLTVAWKVMGLSVTPFAFPFSLGFVFGVLPFLLSLRINYLLIFLLFYFIVFIYIFPFYVFGFTFF